MAWLMALLVSLIASGCYDRRTTSVAATSSLHPLLTKHQADSISFSETHHYTTGYNFAVKADSLMLISQQPEEMVSGLMVDSFAVARHGHLVVADIRMVPHDKTDSVWVQLGTEDARLGWTHEQTLMQSVVPDDPISLFIDTFSGLHTLLSLVIIAVIGSAYLLRIIFRQKAHMVHFNDIRSFYPTALCLLVAASATLYASIQMFAPDVWRNFFFHPTLNPFSQPPLLLVFLLSVWGMLIVGIAALDDVWHQLPFGEMLLYVGGLAAVCSTVYIVFSLSTLYYVGYPLLIIYMVASFRHYFLHTREHYICGHCGARMRQKGVCPVCGSKNL